MNKVFLILSAFVCLPAYANPVFKYQSTCYLESKAEFSADTCTIVETREKGGGLKTRNIYSNRFGLTIKGRFDKEKGFMTWDSHNKFEYKWDYKVGRIDGTTEPHTYVMPGFLVENISWD